MSENQEFEMNQGFESSTTLPANAEMKAEMIEAVKKINVDETIDSQSYFLGEVPQTHLVDPGAYLPLNSDRLVTSHINSIEKLLLEVGILVEEEVAGIQKHQKKITFWEERIETNKANIQKNELQIKQNINDALYNKKNRDYWLGRAEFVETDYSHAEVSARHQNWAWLIKKYGLKAADGNEINAKSHCVEEQCDGEIKNLSAEYRNTATKYDNARKEKETENRRLVQENAKFMGTNETLQGYIGATYTNDIEPLQDGVLLLKELGVKLKSLSHDATYNDIRAWAESFLNEFVKTNHRVPQNVVTNFRRLTSIPLPPEYC